MTYPKISDEEARIWWYSWHKESESAAERTSPPERPEVILRETADEVDYGELCEGLVNQLDSLLSEREGDKRISHDRFEAEGAIILYDGLGMSPPVSDPEFWIWLAVSPGADLVAKRYPAAEMKIIPDRSNFTSASARETLFYRLWARGHLGKDLHAEDPHHLTRSGDIDFWRSHILRQSLTEARAFRHAFIRFQYPAGSASAPRLHTHEIRGLIKRLKRAAANINTEMLEPEQARQMIEREWKQLQESRESGAN